MKRTVGALVAALMMGSLAFAPASAKTVLKANSQWPDVHTGSKVAQWWSEEISRRTNGEVEVQVFFGSVLGKPQENLELLRQGAIDVALMSPGYFPAQLPFHSAPNSIPMSMAKVEEGTELMLRLMGEIDSFAEEARTNGVKTLFFQHLNPYLLVCKEPVTSVAGMAGKKVRTWGEPLPRSISAVGGTPVTLYSPEIYEALSRGTVDCIPTSVDQVLNFKWYEVATYIMDITIWAGPTNGVWISLSAWERLTGDQQAIVEAVSVEAMYRDRDATLEAGTLAAEELLKLGVHFIEFPEEEKMKWKAANPDFFSDFISDMERRGKGEDARRAVEIWKEVSSVL